MVLEAFHIHTHIRYSQRFWWISERLPKILSNIFRLLVAGTYARTFATEV